MEEITNELKEKYDLPYDVLRQIKSSATFVRFEGLECTKCRTKYNIPIFHNRSTWQCSVCQHTNYIPTDYRLQPFAEPDLGSTKNHHRGIKVMLTNGQVGRVQEILR